MNISNFNIQYCMMNGMFIFCNDILTLKKFTLMYSFNSYDLKNVNPIDVRGTMCHTFFRKPFLHEKGVLRSEIS